jgi:SAM-dependent methyltransferase
MSREMKAMTATRREEDLRAFSPNISEHFFYQAYTDMNFLLRSAERSSLNLRTIGSILELGCGSARLLRLLRCIKDVRLVGTDTNPACITYCQENVPGPEYFANEERPPLAFAEAASFDLVYAYSVFTHIPLEWQSEWLHEIHRILRPAGFFLCTVLGWNYEQSVLAPEDREQLRREGQLTLGSDHPRLSYSSQVVGIPDVFQRRDRVIEAFGRELRLLDFVPAMQGPFGQDLLILRKVPLS